MECREYALTPESRLVGLVLLRGGASLRWSFYLFEDHDAIFELKGPVEILPTTGRFQYGWVVVAAGGDNLTAATRQLAYYSMPNISPSFLAAAHWLTL